MSAGWRVVVVAAVLYAALTAMAPLAGAHSELAAQTPSPGATVERLDEVRLLFRAPLQPDGQHAIRVLGPGGVRWDNHGTQLVSDRELVVGVASTVARRGEYTVRWCALDGDGHPQTGAYRFSYTGPTDASARPPGPPADVTGCAQPDRGAAAALLGWGLVGVIAAALVVGTGAALLTRERPDPG